MSTATLTRSLARPAPECDARATPWVGRWESLDRSMPSYSNYVPDFARCGALCVPEGPEPPVEDNGVSTTAEDQVLVNATRPPFTSTRMDAGTLAVVDSAARARIRPVHQPLERCVMSWSSVGEFSTQRNELVTLWSLANTSDDGTHQFESFHSMRVPR